MTEETTTAKTKRFCSRCGTTKTSLETARWFSRKDRVMRESIFERWRADGQGRLMCRRCYSKFYAREHHRHLSRFLYKEKRLSRPSKNQQPLRNGICAFCGVKRGDINPKTGKIIRTNTAHIQYHDDNPLKDTVELCSSCHRILDYGIPADRKCCICKSKETYINKQGYAQWRKRPQDGEFMCGKCYSYLLV